MKPTLFLPFIHSYGVMLAIGFYAGWWLAARRARAEKIDPDAIGNIVLIAIVAGVVGSRLVWYAFYRNPAEHTSIGLEAQGMVCVFYPEDGHMPAGLHKTDTQARKIIVKVRATPLD